MFGLRSAVFAVLVGVSGMAMAQGADGPIPDKRITVTRDVDFPGGDLRSIFDTSFEGCRTACLNDAQCGAFTFNARSNSCFPKTAASDPEPYAGALSARVIATDAGVLARATDRRADLSFLSDQDIAEATKLALSLGNTTFADGRTVGDLVLSARDLRAAGRRVDAMAALGAALTLTDSAELWAYYGEIAREEGTKGDYSARRYLDTALSAYINAYLRAETDAIRAAHLGGLAEMLELKGRGRAMIPALRLATDLSPREDLVADLNRAIGQYGFRVIETRVDNNATEPRICAVFSENLRPAGTDYATFVSTQTGGLAISAEDAQLCVNGVQHGERYHITLRAGLPGTSGEVLQKDVTLTQYVRDRDPVVRFPGRAYVLPATGSPSIPIVTVNTDRVDLRIRRVAERNLLRAVQDQYFGRPLSPWQEDSFAGTVAEDIWTGTGEVANSINAETTTRLPLEQALAGLPAGIYVLQASVPDTDPYDVAPATQWFVISDLGFSTLQGNDGLHVFARSLADTTPRAGVEVSVLSRSNRVLATDVTDADGYLNVQPGFLAGTGGAEPALIVLRDGESDISFMSLTDPAFDLSDRGVTGRAPPEPIDVFLTTDRGAYRAGETIYATALARDPAVVAQTDVPLTAILRRPDGVEYARVRSDGAALGGHVFDFDLLGGVPRGTWSVAIYADPDRPALARSTVLVEDFLPERFDFDLTYADGAVTVQADYLFGAPAVDLPVEGELTLTGTRYIDAYPGYQFGAYDAEVPRGTSYFGGAEQTDATGQAVIDAALPDIDLGGWPATVNLTLRLREGSGRPVERRLSQPVTTEGTKIGIKPLFDDVLPEGTEARFEVLTLGDGDAPAPRPVEWEMNRVQTRYQWYQLYGNWNWEPVTTRTRIASGTATTTDGRLSVAEPVEWGEYELVVSETEGDFTRSSVSFYAGWYGGGEAGDSPDRLEMSLDRDGYAIGDTAMLRVVPRYAGTVLITVMDDHLIHRETVQMEAGENRIPLQIDADWGAGAYVGVTLFRAMDADNELEPARAMGIAYAPISPADRRLDVSVATLGDVTPRAPMTTTVSIANLPANEPAYVTLAAVDVGILNLTGFEAPEPDAYFFGQRKLGLGIRDIYGRLIDTFGGAAGITRSGGDASAQMRLQSPPPTEDLVAYFSGPLPVGADGTVSATFDIPAFNGTVRLMAMAWSAEGVGQATTDVIIADPVVMTASVPRFMAPGDETVMLLDLQRTEALAGDVTFAMSTSDGLTITSPLPTTVALPQTGAAHLRIPLRAGGVGTHTVNLSLTLGDGTELTKVLTIPVMRNDPETTRTNRFDVVSGASFNLTQDVFDGYGAGTARATLAFGPLARFDAPGLLQGLDRYPYGCTEQITARALPLLYFNQVAGAMGLGGADELTERLNTAVAEVLTNQASNGSFGLWSPETGDLWLDAYVTDFLGRARANGLTVPDLAYTQALDNLRNQVNYAADFESGGDGIAYALMVLARDGRAAIGDLRYYADVKADAFTTPLGAAQLGAALAFYGEQIRADYMFAQASRLMTSRLAEDEARIWRADNGTNRRDAAAIVALATEAGTNAVNLERLIDAATDGPSSRTTQEAAWTLLAAHALVDNAAVQRIFVNDVQIEGPTLAVLEQGVTENGMAVRNGGGQDVQMTLTTYGVPEVAPPAGGAGYDIARSYYTMDGEPVDPGTVATGTRLVTVVDVTPYQRAEARLMVTDRLPAGFEIDNPNLLRGGDVRALDWLNAETNVANAEFRQDRFMAAIDWSSDRPFRLAYIVRATVPGAYHHPAATVEDMYRPDQRAWTDAGRVTVQ